MATTASVLPARIAHSALVKAVESLGIDPQVVRSFAFLPDGIESVSKDVETGETSTRKERAIEVVVFDHDEAGARIAVFNDAGEYVEYQKSTHLIPVL